MPLNVLIFGFGATGVVGQGVLHERLLDPDVARVRTVGRTATAVRHPKYSEIAHADSMSYAPIEGDLTGFDAYFSCLGVSSVGMAEADDERITCGITLVAASTLARLMRTRGHA